MVCCSGPGSRDPDNLLADFQDQAYAVMLEEKRIGRAFGAALEKAIVEEEDLMRGAESTDGDDGSAPI